MSELIQHFEKHLGPVVSGWTKGANQQQLPFQVVLMQTSPIEGARVLTTLGLSNVALRVGSTSRRLRQELMFMFRASDGPRNLPGVLQQVGLEANYAAHQTLGT